MPAAGQARPSQCAPASRPRTPPGRPGTCRPVCNVASPSRLMLAALAERSDTVSVPRRVFKVASGPVHTSLLHITPHCKSPCQSAAPQLHPLAQARADPCAMYATTPTGLQRQAHAEAQAAEARTADDASCMSGKALTVHVVCVPWVCDPAYLRRHAHLSSFCCGVPSSWPAVM
jgi:hypothetical protein